MPDEVTNSRMSAARALIRAIVLCLTAFVANLSVEQVAAIQLLLEAVLALAVALTPDRRTPPR